MFSVFFVAVVGLCSSAIAFGYSDLAHLQETACFNTVLELSCGIDEVIVLDTARYGRNDTRTAERCGVPYQRTCDIDAHFNLNKLCAGQPTCSVAVNTELFGDPCGYNEFLKVTYNCITVHSMHRSCQSEQSPVLFDHGYIASPNYPMKYYLEANCVWHLAVQQRQTIRIVLYDFELAVRKMGRCDDYLLIEGVDGVQYFQDCGSLGKQTIEIPANEATAHFRTSTNTLTQRGFFFYFEAVGPGCPDLDGIANASITYEMTEDQLFANITCDYGFIMIGRDLHLINSPPGVQQLTCTGSTWNAQPASCLEVTTTTPLPPTSPGVATSHLPVARQDPEPVMESGSVIGIVLGVTSAVLLIILLIVLSLYLHRSCKERMRNNPAGASSLYVLGHRRRKAEEKLDHWRVVINNLQEGTLTPDGGYTTPNVDINKYGSCGSASAASLHSIRKGNARRSKINHRNNHLEDEVQGRNLLSPVMLDDDECYESPKNYTTSTFNYDMETFRPNTSVSSRRSSRTGRYSLARSRECELDEREDEGFREPYKPPRRPKHRRSKSGVWDNRINHARAAVYAQETLCSPVRQPVERRLVFTRSAPDLLEMLDAAALATPCGDDSDDLSSIEGGLRMNNTTAPLVDNRDTRMSTPTKPHPPPIGRSSTLGAMYVGSRTPSTPIKTYARVDSRYQYR